MSITRRHLLPRSGAGLAAAGAATVLSACGGDGRPERSSERDGELLQEALTAEATLSAAYETASDQQLGGRVAAAVAAFGDQSREHIALLSAGIEDAGGSPDEQPGEPAAAESAVEAVRAAIEASIAAGHLAVGGLESIDARRTVYRVMIADAAQLAAVRGILGEQQVPVAFVTGAPEPPLAVDPDTGSSEGGGS